MRIVIETIPHVKQRYPTTGDWWFDSAGDLQIRVSDMGRWEYEALVGIHEATEALLCKRDGVEEEDITAFDIEFEKAREASAGEDFMFRDRLYDKNAEPGDALEAPYRNQHCYATAVERMLCAAFGFGWERYDLANLDLYEGNVPK